MTQPTEFCMPALLRQWALERSTGTMMVFAAPPSEVVATLLVESGAVVFATSRHKRDPTGDLFLELFQVPPLDPESLVERAQIEHQIVRVITGLFNWPVAVTQFQDGIH